jgi:acyl-coenzyme A thioesterase PaaI-like protein
LFTLGEAASGAAMAGGFLLVLAKVRPVAATANIQYLKVARGLIRAHARIGEATELLRMRLEEAGKVQFAIAISMTDKGGTEVATMQVEWHVSRLRSQ